MLDTDRLQSSYNLLSQLFELEFASEEDIWELILQETCVGTSQRAGTFFSVDMAKETLQAVHAIGIDKSVLAKVPIRYGEGICGWVARNRATVLAQDVSKEPRFFDAVDKVSGFKTKSILCVPAIRKKDLFGVIEIVSAEVGAFTYADREYLEFMAHAGALVAENIRVNKAMQKVSAHNANILENLSGGFIGIDTKDRVLICNNRAKQILQIQLPNPVGEPVEGVLQACPEMISILKETLASRQAFKRREFQWNREGEAKTIGYSTLLFQDVKGRLAGAGITFQDITKR